MQHEQLEATTLSLADGLRIASQAFVHPRTVLAVYEQRPTRQNIQQRVANAARELGLPAPPKGADVLSRNDQLRIALQAGVDPRTVYAAYAGRPTRPNFHGRIAQAAQELSLPAPPNRQGKAPKTPS